MPATLRRHVNPNACTCFDPDVPPSACPCGGRAREHFARQLWAAPRSFCLRCDRGRHAVTEHGLCDECLDELNHLAARLLRGAPTTEEAPHRACAWCGVAADDLLGRDGLFLCDTCVACGRARAWTAVNLGACDATPVACSFCERVAPPDQTLVGPIASVCARCFEAACELRRRDHRDPCERMDLSCSFDGKSLHELREIYASVEGLAFCDECLPLMEDIFGEQPHARELDLRVADPGVRCRWCGSLDPGAPILCASRGPAFCARCIASAPRVGRWCNRCRRPAWRGGGVLDVGVGLWCLGCVRRETRVSALLRAAGIVRPQAPAPRDPRPGAEQARSKRASRGARARRRR